MEFRVAGESVGVAPDWSCSGTCPSECDRRCIFATTTPTLNLVSGQEERPWSVIVDSIVEGTVVVYSIDLVVQVGTLLLVVAMVIATDSLPRLLLTLDRTTAGVDEVDRYVALPSGEWRVWPVCWCCLVGWVMTEIRQSMYSQMYGSRYGVYWSRPGKYHTVHL